MEDIRESIAQMQEMFQLQMDNFQSELQKTSSTTSASLASDFASFKNFILKALQSLQNQVQALARNQDNMEMYSRRKILLFHGLPESSGEDTVAVVVQTIVNKLKIADFSKNNISRCHRMGRTAGDKPRPVLVKICDMPLRSKLWQAKSKLKGSGVTLSEFLTKPRHDVFMAARKKFGISQCWTRDGWVFVLGTDGVRHRVSMLSELSSISSPQPAATRPAAIESKASAAAPKPKPAAATKTSKRVAAKNKTDSESSH